VTDEPADAFIQRNEKQRTVKRYRAVFAKFRKFAGTTGVEYWEQVHRRVLEGYATWLDEEKYAPRTVYLELTTLKQAIKWLIGERHLPEGFRNDLQLSKPNGCDAYCWREAEVQAMVSHCNARDDLTWLGQVLVALAFTGLRIGELAQLRWAAVDFEAGMLRVIDNSRFMRRRGTYVHTTTKTHASRSLPIHPELRKVLDLLERRPDGRVFHGPQEGVLKPDTVRNILIREVLKPLSKRFPPQAGTASFVDGRLHSFRHFFCSKCARDGIPEQTARLWLGYRDSAMVKHYFHLHDEDVQRQMNKLKSVGEGGAA
jgi:site-specific recombinase XerD